MTKNDISLEKSEHRLYNGNIIEIQIKEFLTMFCEKCGAQLPDDAKFCEACGSSTEPGAAAGPGAVAAEAVAPSAAAIAIKKFFSNKRNVIITVAALVLVVAAIILIVVLANQPKKIYIDDYFDVVFNGTDGYGRAYMDSTEKQMEKLEKLNKKLFPNGEHHIGNLLRISFDMTSDQQGSLKNGDTVKIKLDVGDFYKYVDGYEIALRNKTVKVKGLKEVKEVSLLDLYSPIFSGVNGFGRISSEQQQTVSLPHGYSATFEGSYDSLYIRILDNEGSFIESFYYDVDKYEDLTNGDVITVTANNNTNSEYLANSHALKLTDTSKTYTVSGLKEPQTFNFLDHVSFTFTGMGYRGVMELALPSDSVTFDGKSIKLTDQSSYYSTYFEVEVTDENGYYLCSVTYYADKNDELKNGDVITFETYSDESYMVANCGILFPQSFTVTVEGLTEPVTPDIINRGTLTFSGYNGFGTYTYVLPDDQCVYTIGEYTFKLTLDQASYENRINVVIADSTGVNFYSFDYYAYTHTGLSNENTLTFYSTAYSSDLEELLEERGIYIPDDVTFEVSGLTEPTVTNPLDQATFTATAVDGEVVVSCTLKASSYTVNGYTVNLSVEEYDSWSSSYIDLNYAIYNGQTLVGEGYYHLRKDGYREGNTAYISHYSSDEHDIVTATGIVFAYEEQSFIVSSK